MGDAEKNGTEGWLDLPWRQETLTHLHWPEGGRLMEQPYVKGRCFTVRLANILQLAAETYTAGFTDASREPALITCWRDIVDADLSRVLRLRHMGRKTAAELLAHLRRVGVEPAWAGALEHGKRRKAQPAEAPAPSPPPPLSPERAADLRRAEQPPGRPLSEAYAEVDAWLDSLGAPPGFLLERVIWLKAHSQR